MRESEQLQEKKMKEERMREVLLLLEHLISHEEITIKLILDCLYDVGTVNFINKKFQQSLLKRPVKKVAGVSKPVVKVFAFRWFKRNCPELITNWLYSKVSFPEPVRSPESVAPQVAPQVVVAEPVALMQSENLNHEIRRLRGQVRLLSGISIGAVAALSGVLVWMNHRPEVGASPQLIPPSQPVRAEAPEPQR